MPGFIITLGACATRGTVFLCWYSSVMLIIYSKLKNEKKWKTTNHSRASCFIRSRMTSRPHRLKKTSSMQSKRRDLHHTWLHRGSNENLSFNCYSPWWITTKLFYEINRIFYCNAISCNKLTVNIFSSKQNLRISLSRSIFYKKPVLALENC